MTPRPAPSAAAGADEHTPGPWFLDRRDHSSNSVDVFVAGRADPIINLFCEETFDDEDHANARLIAAAPLLLAELRQYVRGDDPRSDRAKRCAQIIAKATGATP